MTESHQKIGVLTFHRCINYGSYWQARCLVEGLRARGHNAVLLDYHSRRADAAEWKCGLQPVLPTHVPKGDYPLYGLKMLKFFRAFSALPRSHRFTLEHPEEMECFDRVIVGSDEVWNLRHPWYGGCALFYGTDVQTRHLVSYAASFGNYSAEEGLDISWANRLKAFDAISVRDENARRIVRNVLGIEPETVLDPCLQFLPRPAGEWHGADHPYIAMYGHNFSQYFREQVRSWAERCGYQLVSIGYRNDWADSQWITASPDDFAHFMAHAEAIATNFFHGCVFALRYMKPFICEASSYRSNKLRDLMTAVGGEQHLVSEETPVDTYGVNLGEPLEGSILQKIESLRRTSKAYLDRVLD